MGQVNIVGVVISQLDKLKVTKGIDSMPENVNFGIKASTVRQLVGSFKEVWTNRREIHRACENCTESSSDGDVSEVNMIIVWWGYEKTCLHI